MWKIDLKSGLNKYYDYHTSRDVQVWDWVWIMGGLGSTYLAESDWTLGLGDAAQLLHIEYQCAQVQPAISKTHLS